MRQQLLPLILCLFTTFAVCSNSNFISGEANQTLSLSANNIVLTDSFINPDNYKNELFNTFNGITNSTPIDGLFYYNSEYQIGGGISLSEEFSYNIVEINSIGTATNFSALHLQGDLFNKGMFYGFSLTVILLNLVCFFVFDEKLFVYFSATIAALTSIYFFSEGLFPLIGIDIVQTEITQSTFLLIGIGLSALFASKYLTVKEYYPKLNNITVPLIIISTLMISAAWILGDIFIATLANSLLLGLISLYFITGVLLFSRKNYAKFYVIATFIPLLFSFDFFVLRNFGVDFLFTEAIHLKIATLFEILLLSYAILYRMQAVKDEEELRQTEMRIFLKRQDVMARNQVEQMVEDVYLENLIMQYDLDGLEIKLLQYISEGKANTKIARKLKLTENEVVEHTKELYLKLEISEHIQEDYRMVDNQPDFIYN